MINSDETRPNGREISREKTGVTPLHSGDLMESPIQTMWKWHLINDLSFQPGDTLERCFIHKRIAVAILRKEHLSKSAIDSGLLNRVSRLKHDANLVLYGDLLKVREQHETTATREAVR